MAESKTGAGIDQWLLSRRNTTGMEKGEGGRIIHVCLGTDGSGVHKPKFLTKAINNQFSNSDDTFKMLGPEIPESSRNLNIYQGINRLSSKR